MSDQFYASQQEENKLNGDKNTGDSKDFQLLTATTLFVDEQTTATDNEIEGA